MRDSRTRTHGNRDLCLSESAIYHGLVLESWVVVLSSMRRFLSSVPTVMLHVMRNKFWPKQAQRRHFDLMFKSVASQSLALRTFQDFPKHVPDRLEMRLRIKLLFLLDMLLLTGIK